MRRWLTIALATIAPRAAHAGGVLGEIATGAAATPGSQWVSDKLAATLDLDASWQLQLDGSSTRMLSDATDTPRDAVYQGSLSAAYSPDGHWSLRLNGSVSPASTTLANVAVNYLASDEDPRADVRLRAAVSSLAFGAGLDYDSAADDVHALSASLSVTATYFRTAQEILGVTLQDPSGTSGAILTPADMRMRCQGAPCSSELAGALWPQWVQLGQFAVGASVTDTVDGTTDLSLDASYYLYDHDPLQSGYYGLETIARDTLGSATSAPLLREAIAPSVAHRWGDVAASVNLSYSDYVDGRAYDVSAGLRVQYKLAVTGSQRLKLYAKLGASAHVDKNYALMRSSSIGLGAQYAW